MSELSSLLVEAVHNQNIDNETLYWLGGSAVWGAITTGGESPEEWQPAQRALGRIIERGADSIRTGRTVPYYGDARLLDTEVPLQELWRTNQDTTPEAVQETYSRLGGLLNDLLRARPVDREKHFITLLRTTYYMLLARRPELDYLAVPAPPFAHIPRTEWTGPFGELRPACDTVVFTPDGEILPTVVKLHTRYQNAQGGFVPGVNYAPMGQILARERYRLPKVAVHINALSTRIERYDATVRATAGYLAREAAGRLSDESHIGYLNAASARCVSYILRGDQKMAHDDS